MSFTNISERLSAIEARLFIIENQLDICSNTNRPETEMFELSEDTKGLRLIQAAKSGNWLGIVAVVCFILATGLIIKLSIDTGWLKPERQLGLATLFGLGVMVAGIKLLYLGRSYANLLPAAGLVILYLTVFSGYRFYHLISFQTAIAMTSVVSGLCIWFYIKLKHDIYAVIAAMGAYLGPTLMELDGNTIFTLYYYIISSLTFSTISIWVQSRTLTVLSAYLAIMITSFVGLHLQQDVLIAVVLTLYFFIFSIGTYFHTQLTQRQLTEKESWSLFPVLLILYAMEYYFINRIEPSLAPWVSLGFAGLLISLCLSAKKWFPERGVNSQEMILAFTTLVCFHSVYLDLLPTLIRPWLFVAIFLGFCSPLKEFYLKITRGSIIPAIAMFTIIGIEYLDMLGHLLGVFNMAWFIVSLASFASMWFMLLQQRDFLVKNDEYSYFILLGTAHLLGITGLFQLTNSYGSLAISAAWLFYAIAVVSLAYARQDKIMAKTTLIPLFFATGKALLYDATATPTTVTISCLLLTGIVLYGSGIIIKNMTERRD